MKRPRFTSPRFTSTNQPITCKVCKASTTHAAGQGTGLCSRCFLQSNLTNEHEDGMHDDVPSNDCPLCCAGSECGS